MTFCPILQKHPSSRTVSDTNRGEAVRRLASARGVVYDGKMSLIFGHLDLAWLNHIPLDVFLDGVLRQQEIGSIFQEPNTSGRYQFPDPLLWPASLSGQFSWGKQGTIVHSSFLFAK